MIGGVMPVERKKRPIWQCGCGSRRTKNASGTQWICVAVGADCPGIPPEPVIKAAPTVPASTTPDSQKLRYTGVQGRGVSRSVLSLPAGTS